MAGTIGDGLNLGYGIQAPLNPKDQDKHPGSKPNGLYVYTVSYDSDELDDLDEDWHWLQGGSLRGQAPWGGVVL